MIVGVVGSGAWGRALAITAARGGADVILWSYDGLVPDFEDTAVGAKIQVTRNMADLSSTDIWLITTPSAFFADTMNAARSFYPGVPVINCAKGMEYSTGRFMSEILHDVLPECMEYGVLSGPQFAAEVAAGIPTGSTLAGTPFARRIGHDVLNKFYISEIDDVIGTEICGVGKNAVALICGYNSVGLGENERAMIFTRAWNEVVALGRAMGAKEATFLDLCGIGDLFLCTTSPSSRNFAAGQSIAAGIPPIGTIEGIGALHGILQRAGALGIAMPVLNEMAEKM